jgi:PPE-repeat protein
MDFGALPPEINSGRMYAGPGSAPMLAAASSWDALAAELQSAASAYASAISSLTSEAWVGPSSASMAAAATPYVTWMSETAVQAEQAAMHAKAAAAAYAAAFAMTVPPPVIAANRVLLAQLVATNILGQNTPAIMLTEAHYREMWAQDATAMYGYAGESAAASTLTPFSSPPSTTNPGGISSQAAAVGQSTGTAAGTGQASLSQLITTLLNGLASPGSVSTGLAPAPAASTVTSSLTPTGGGLFGSISGGSIMQGMITQYGFLPGLFGMFMGANALGPLITTPMNMALASGASAAAAAAPPLAGLPGLIGLPGVAAAAGGLGSGLPSGLGGLAGLGQAASIGALSVPPSWALAAAAPLGALSPVATPLALSADGFGAAGIVMPLILGGLPRAALAGATGGGAGPAGINHGPQPKVMARPPDAGYPAEPVALANAKYPAVAGYSLNGHTPPGYRAAIVYLPIDGQEPAPV